MTPYEIQSMREPLELAELLLRASEGVDVALGLALGGGWGAAAALRTEAKCDPSGSLVVRRVHLELVGVRGRAEAPGDVCYVPRVHVGLALSRGLLRRGGAVTAIAE